MWALKKNFFFACPLRGRIWCTQKTNMSSAIDHLDSVLDIDARAQLRLAIAKVLAALRLEATAAVQKELEEAR